MVNMPRIKSCVACTVMSFSEFSDIWDPMHYCCRISQPSLLVRMSLHQHAIICWVLTNAADDPTDDPTDGLVSYTRTDGVDISEDAVEKIRYQIVQEFGAAYLSPSVRSYKCAV